MDTNGVASWLVVQPPYGGSDDCDKYNGVQAYYDAASILSPLVNVANATPYRVWLWDTSSSGVDVNSCIDPNSSAEISGTTATAGAYIHYTATESDCTSGTSAGITYQSGCDDSAWVVLYDGSSESTAACLVSVGYYFPAWVPFMTTDWDSTSNSDRVWIHQQDGPGPDCFDSSAAYYLGDSADYNPTNVQLTDIAGDC